MARKKPGPPKGTMPKNYGQFAEGRKQTQFAPGYSGQTTRQVEGTQKLTDWLDQYDNGDIERFDDESPAHTQPDSVPVPIPIPDAPVVKTHDERVKEMLERIRPTKERMIDNDTVSLIKNYKG